MVDNRAAEPDQGSVDPSREQDDDKPRARLIRWRPEAPFWTSSAQYTPTELFELVCYVNYNTPPPHPVDPAVMFDMLKIRRLIDDASRLFQEAEDGHDSPFTQGRDLTQRARLRRRETACKKLSEALRIDENSGAVLLCKQAQLEDVAAKVLRTSPANPDARYLHFFQERVFPSQVATPESLALLEELVEASDFPGILRTRAEMNILLGKNDDAINELTAALRQRCSVAGARQPQPPIGPPQQRNPKQSVPEDEMPCSLSSQLLFRRAGCYLEMACSHISASFAPEQEGPQASCSGPTEQLDEPLLEKRIDSQKRVKFYAKSAMRDLLAFLERLQYSPDWPIEAAHDLHRFFHEIRNAPRRSRVPTLKSTCPPATNRLYKVSELFAPVTPSDLPPYPPPAATDGQSSASDDIVEALAGEWQSPLTVCESVTFHPNLAQALHSLLLCHCLVQTSPKEIQRHAYMVARLCRLCDGFPVLQTVASSSRSDWKELLQYPTSETRLLPLAASWNDLCAARIWPLMTHLGISDPTTKMKDDQSTNDKVYHPGLVDNWTLGAFLRDRVSDSQRSHLTPFVVVPGCRQYQATEDY